jgi:hypothetical protein
MRMQRAGRKRTQTSGRTIDCMDRIPTLIDREITIYLRIAAARAADIESGPLANEVLNGGPDLPGPFNCVVAQTKPSHVPGRACRSTVHRLSSGPGSFLASERYFNPCKRDCSSMRT